jgi:hypothetical protein
MSIYQVVTHLVDQGSALTDLGSHVFDAALSAKKESNSVIPPVAPNLDGVPGGTAVQKVISAAAAFAIAAATLAFLYGAGQAAVGSNQGNSGLAADGRKKMIWAPVIVALVIATPSILKWGADLGKNF